jgi:hypothetical protein
MATIPPALASRLFVSGDAPLLRPQRRVGSTLQHRHYAGGARRLWGVGYSFLREHAAAVDHAALPEATADGDGGGVDGPVICV